MVTLDVCRDRPIVAQSLDQTQGGSLGLDSPPATYTAAPPVLAAQPISLILRGPIPAEGVLLLLVTPTSYRLGAAALGERPATAGCPGLRRVGCLLCLPPQHPERRGATGPTREGLHREALMVTVAPVRRWTSGFRGRAHRNVRDGNYRWLSEPNFQSAVRSLDEHRQFQGHHHS